jgi:hypothetical protein
VTATAGPERLTKLDVVQRQLRTAIRMFFEDGDSVSAYTLAAAVEGVLGGLLKKQGKVHPFRESDIIKEGMEREFNSILNRSQNFFKHAATDADGVHDFPDIALEYELFQCVVLYQLVRGRLLAEAWIFLVWFGIHHPDVVNDGPFKALLANLKRQAPNIATTKSTWLEILNRRDLYPIINVE